MSKLEELGRKAAQNAEPGSAILNDEAAMIIYEFDRYSQEWNDAIGEFVNGFATERLRMMGQ